MAEIPLPTIQDVAIFVVAYLAGSVTPYYYLSERVRGFGRAVGSRLPYSPPPGMDEEEALQRAAQQGRSTEAAEDHDGYVKDDETNGESSEN